MVLLFIDSLRASWMMSEQMVLWEHERTADERTPDLSPLESWKKQGKLIASDTSEYDVLSRQTFSLCLSLLCLPRPLFLVDPVHAEILVSPPLHRPHTGKHQSWRLLQPGRSKLCHPGSKVCS